MVSFTGLSLQKALDVAKGDVGVVADVRSGEILQSESEPAGSEDYDTNSPVGEVTFSHLREQVAARPARGRSPATGLVYTN